MEDGKREIKRPLGIAVLFTAGILFISAVFSICQAITIAAFISKQFFFNELVPNVYSILGTLCALKQLYNYCLWWNSQALSGYYVAISVDLPLPTLASNKEDEDEKYNDSFFFKKRSAYYILGIVLDVMHSSFNFILILLASQVFL